MPECGHCGTTDLAYQLESDRGPVVRCLECLAIEQIQQQLNMPFEVWIDRDDIDPPDHPDAPDIDPFDPRRHDYLTARAWGTVLARLKENDPICHPDANSPGAIFEDTREFIINVMGDDAHKRPSELRADDTGGEDDA